MNQLPGGRDYFSELVDFAQKHRFSIKFGSFGPEKHTQKKTKYQKSEIQLYRIQRDQGLSHFLWKLKQLVAQEKIGVSRCHFFNYGITCT